MTWSVLQPSNSKMFLFYERITGFSVTKCTWSITVRWSLPIGPCDNTVTTSKFWKIRAGVKLRLASTPWMISHNQFYPGFGDLSGNRNKLSVIPSDFFLGCWLRKIKNRDYFRRIGFNNIFYDKTTQLPWGETHTCQILETSEKLPRCSWITW